VTKYDCTNFPSTCRVGYSADPKNQPLSLRINADSKFTGIIITDELIRLNGDFELLGGLVSLTTNAQDIPANGGGYVRWSCDAVQNALQSASSYSVKLAWGQVMEE
jgi:hypothetical protein